VAGTGINITGNTISATGGNSLWVTDANGIHDQPAGNVGINTNSQALVALTVHHNNTNGGNAVLHLRSDDVFHSALTMFNSTLGPSNHYSLILGGTSNTEVFPGNFALVNHEGFSNGAPVFPMLVRGNNSFVGIGLHDPPAILPRSRLHVFNGDINIEQIGSGIILKSPNGQCWRVTIDNAGNLVRTAIACP
jgi:hypothetical protein